MPLITPTFEITSGIARHNPTAFYAYRSRLIDRTIASGVTTSHLQALQAEIDALRASTVNPQQSVISILEIVAGKLGSLTEVLAHFQHTIDTPGADEQPLIRSAQAQAEALISAVDALRGQILDSLPPETG